MTFIELLKASLLKCGAIDVNETPTAEMGVSGLIAFNNMLAQWQLDGIDLGFYTVQAQDDVVPLSPANLRGVIFNFAIELSTDGLGAIPDDVRRIAGETYAALCKSSRQTFEADMTMLPQADGWNWGQFFANGGLS